MAVLLDGRVVGSIGGGCAEASVIEEARLMGPGAAPKLMAVDLTDSAEEDGMVCGGRMEILLEPLF
jgi:xanthine dehydrogenase accessory factor